MAVAAASDGSQTILLNFGWRGPTDLCGGFGAGGQTVNSVQLVFQQVADYICVSIPSSASSKEAPEFFFQVNKVTEYEADNSLKKELCIKEVTTSEYCVLRATIQQIRQLQLVVNLFQVSPEKKITSVRDANVDAEFSDDDLEEPFVEQNIPLQVPEELNAGEEYTLQVTSEHDLLLARIVKPGPAKITDLKTMSTETLLANFTDLFRRDKQYQHLLSKMADKTNTLKYERYIDKIFTFTVNRGNHEMLLKQFAIELARRGESGREIDLVLATDKVLDVATMTTDLFHDAL